MHALLAVISTVQYAVRMVVPPSVQSIQQKISSEADTMLQGSAQGICLVYCMG